jgi:hypothetical protein
VSALTEVLPMEKADVSRSEAGAMQTTLPGLPAVDESDGRGGRRRALIDRARAQRACAPIGALYTIVVSRDSHGERSVFYVVDPDTRMAPHYAAHGITLEPGCKVLVDAELMRPVALIELDPDTGAEDAETSTPCGFNPYWDLPPS